jgi:hypothetical protein
LSHVPETLSFFVIFLIGCMYVCVLKNIFLLIFHNF